MANVINYSGPYIIHYTTLSLKYVSLFKYFHFITNLFDMRQEWSLAKSIVEIGIGVISKHITSFVCNYKIIVWNYMPKSSVC